MLLYPRYAFLCLIALIITDLHCCSLTFIYSPRSCTNNIVANAPPRLTPSFHDSFFNGTNSSSVNGFESYDLLYYFPVFPSTALVNLFRSRLRLCWKSSRSPLSRVRNRSTCHRSTCFFSFYKETPKGKGQFNQPPPQKK